MRPNHGALFDRPLTTTRKRPSLPAPIPAAVHPVDLVLHIGTGKTGTTSIQSFMDANRRPLADLGFLYPRSPGKSRHARISLSVLPEESVARAPAWHRQGFTNHREFREKVHSSLRAELAEAGLPCAILSDEALFGAKPVALERLRRLTDEIARSVRVVLYLRRQDDHVASRYQQVVKVGETRRLVERVQVLDLRGFYDYRAKLARWQDLMAPTAITVRRFERESFVEGSLHQDFLQAAGIDARADSLTQVTQLNESLDAETVELLRILNLFRVEHQGATAGQIDNRALIERLRSVMAADPGPTLTLPTEMQDAFMARWAESNRAVARDFLDDPSGELFRTPRKSGNTTSEQVFDPARLDRFLPVLDLPEVDHVRLRALVEREAATA
jgi:hypothetical protein